MPSPAPASQASQEAPVLQLIQTAVERTFASPAFRDAVRDVIYECAPELSRNLPFMIQVAETLKAARWTVDHLPLHKRFTHETLRREAVLTAPAEGLFLEFGVWRAYWLKKMAAMRPVTFHGFDSFEGLPDAWSNYEKSHFDLGGRLPEVPANVRLVKGWFDQTLAPFLEEHPGPVAFVHVDCDLYSSTKTVLDLLRPRLRAGTTLILDDYFVEPGWDQAEFKAFHEFVETHRIEFEYIGYVTDTPGTAVGVRLLHVP